jgi:Domain of unknown function (DUF4082)/Fibronectin type III domain/Bacterial Ig domain
MSSTGHYVRRVFAPRSVIGLIVVVLLGLLSLVIARPAAAAGPCGPPVTSVIACENTLPGDPPSDWQVSGSGDSTIQGFATSMSVNVGQTENFKINTPAKSYHIDILRIGYYGGDGARKVVSNMLPTATLPQSQPACLNDTASTGLIDCGNWSVSASWTVPSNAVSGLYVAHLVRNDTGGDSLIPFVVRNDASHSDILFQTDDETWQAYNTWPSTTTGNSLYQCNSNCPPGTPEAYKGADAVSYNRPWQSAVDDLQAGQSVGSSWFMYDEYNMIRFLEENGYDVSYTSGVDMSQPGAASIIEQHKIFLTAGHDEYWSGQQRANVQAALNAGVNMAFFTGNEVFWKTRFAASIDGSNTPNRTLVTYKETHYDAPTDPQDPPTWTGSWMDPRFSPPGDGGQPQNALTGQLFAVNSGTTDITVPASYSKLRFWRNTRVASLTSGQSTTLDQGVGTLGYEWDVDADNGFRPPGLFDMSSTTDTSASPFTDYGSQTTTATVTHHLTLYRAPSGALVFGAGTVQWAWGLDNGTGSGNSGGATDPAMQQATVNLFADMGNVQPTTLMSGLVPATPSIDTTPPTSTITSPSPGATLSDGSAVTVTGTAIDAGGGVVAGVEVSTDGGATWHPVTTMSAANASVTWSYSWVAHGNPTATIESRAVDDSGNLEKPAPGTTVNVNCPCSIWGNGYTPHGIDSGDGSSIEVGVKFRTDTFGVVSGVRFYKSSANTGTHIGNLWTSSGQLLASATFTNESASGWQQVNFAQPVLLNPNTTYVASYFAPKGHYSQDEGYFYTVPPIGASASHLDSPPLHALQSTNGLTNGLYSYASGSTFPTNTFNGENYWVDVAFSPAGPPGQASNVTGTVGFASTSLSWTAPTSGGPASTYTITPYIGSVAQPPITVTGSAGSPAPTNAIVTGLTNGTTYTFTVTASNPNGVGPASAPSAPVTPSSSAPIVQNGGFENGLNSWTPSGVALPTASTAKAHSGSGSALLGTVSPAIEPSGDSNISQTVSVPASGKTTLSFWYWPATTDDICSGNACKYDWQEAQVRSTSGQTRASVFKSNSNSQTWTQVTFDMTSYAGQSVVLYFNVHQDGGGDPTWLYLDDVSLTNTSSQPTAPGAPTGVTATSGNGSATVSWTAPSNGGSAITSYTVTPFVGSAAQTPVTVTAPATSTTVTGLTNGTTYTFTVSATNAIGTGSASAPSNAVTPTGPTTPGAPTGVTATSGNGSATVSWTAPSSNGGSAITSYTVTPFVGSAAQTSLAVTVTGNPPATSAMVPGLTNGTSYTFTVSATNAIGTGSASAASNAVTPTGPTAPGAPTAVTATAGNGSATVSWTAPGNGGSAITSYTVTPYVGSTAQTPTVVMGSPPATSTTLPGLVNGTTYTFTVSATNAIGTGPASAASNAVTPTAPTAPGAPTGVTATAGNGSATVSWTAPGSNGGSAITSYTVTPFIGSTAQAPVTVNAPATSTTVNGLTNGTSYTFTVSATNAVGTGPASAASNAVTPTAAGPITMDKTVFTDGSGAMTSPSLTTSSANDLLVAFVASDGPAQASGQTFTVTGAGLTWTLAIRDNSRFGDSEIWYARASGTLTAQTVKATPLASGFHGSLTVIAFAKAAGIGVSGGSSAASGAPDLPVVGTGTGSWVYAVGNDWDNAIARTPVSGQVIVHQRVDTTTGDTFWVQSTTVPNTAAGTVDLHDSAPTTDQWNYVGVEVLPGS